MRCIKYCAELGTRKDDRAEEELERDEMTALRDERVQLGFTDMLTWKMNAEETQN